MKKLGLQTYRFSISWPRVIPEGHGQSNSKGLDFYSRLIDTLLASGITPCVTLYHWDLPQSLQYREGWANRDVAKYFADYADLMFRHFGDRVSRWITHNEPLITAELGHRLGIFAPGISDLKTTAHVIHHLLLSHGYAVQAFRAGDCQGDIGIANANTLFEPVDDRPETLHALERARDFNIRLYHSPIYGQGYPQQVLDFYANRGCALPIQEGDLDIIAQKTDFLGVNLYSRQRVEVGSLDSTGYKIADPILPLTDIGWEAAPHALGEFIKFISKEYDRPIIYITENGVCDNTQEENGTVPDQPRIELLQGFLAGLSQVIDEGANVRGYYLWSLLDNFEWVFGYSCRFGIVWIDYESLERIPKQSSAFFGQVIRDNGLVFPAIEGNDDTP